MAEGIFQHKIKLMGYDDFWESDSAGTGAYHIGQHPDPRTMETLEHHQITFQHFARQIQKSDAQSFDFILAMDRQNLSDIHLIFDSKHEGLFMMRDFDPENKGADVPDPYFGGKDGFEQVYQMLDRSIDHFIEFIRQDQD